MFIKNLLAKVKLSFKLMLSKLFPICKKISSFFFKFIDLLINTRVPNFESLSSNKIFESEKVKNA